LRDVRRVVEVLTLQRERILENTARCLQAATETTNSLDEKNLIDLARKHGVEPATLEAWLNCLGISGPETSINSYLAQKSEKIENYNFIKGWTGPEALSVLANSSDDHVRIPGNMKPHSVAVHPTPSLRVVTGWRSPMAATVRVEGSVQHAHIECGNGVTWAVELRRGNTRQKLAAGFAQDASVVKFGPFENIGVRPGDVVSLAIGPRDGNHSCDLTAVELNLTDGVHTWNLAQDVSADILA